MNTLSRGNSWRLPPRYVGWFFIWTSGIHVGVVAADPGLYQHFADGALVPGLSAAWRSVFLTHATTCGLVIAAGEALVGLLLLSAHWSRRRWGWVGTIAFHVALMGFGWGFWMWCLPALTVLGYGAWCDRSSTRGPRSSTHLTLVDQR